MEYFSKVGPTSRNANVLPAASSSIKLRHFALKALGDEMAIILASATPCPSGISVSGALRPLIVVGEFAQADRINAVARKGVSDIFSFCLAAQWRKAWDEAGAMQPFRFLERLIVFGT